MLEDVARGDPVVQKADVREACRGQHALSLGSAVAAKVAGLLVRLRESVRARRNTDEKVTVGCDERAPLYERRQVVFEMLEDLERADEVELAASNQFEPAVVKTVGIETVLRKSPSCGRDRRQVEIDARVVIPRGEQRSNGSQAHADLENRTRVDLREETAHGIESKPRVN
jgi:hypothetical protein